MYIQVREGVTIEIPSSIWQPSMQQVKGCLMKNCPSDKVSKKKFKKNYFKGRKIYIVIKNHILSI